MFLDHLGRCEMAQTNRRCLQSLYRGRGQVAVTGKPFEKPYHLFDMTKDISERSNVIEKNPEIAMRLETALERIRTSGRSR